MTALIAKLIDAPIPVAVISEPQDLEQQNNQEDNSVGETVTGGIQPRGAARRLMSAMDTGCNCGKPDCPMCNED